MGDILKGMVLVRQRSSDSGILWCKITDLSRLIDIPEAEQKESKITSNAAHSRRDPWPMIMTSSTKSRCVNARVGVIWIPLTRPLLRASAISLILSWRQQETSELHFSTSSRQRLSRRYFTKNSRRMEEITAPYTIDNTASRPHETLQFICSKKRWPLEWLPAWSCKNVKTLKYYLWFWNRKLLTAKSSDLNTQYHQYYRPQG